ncbi:cytochrome P450 [Photorhabdus heterorhabditis]|uniref:cytochrome P450 n=1 Tax=Photorhabdus heterorhabditis TaxID=880156 RepID=UPI00156220D4|nr:cytochrome P450 [Photorhabdus heterorhabditis]NRN30781.1 cytochrome P450 [Photorhabdus heterorhabditis subsp. aluminescens]
MLNPISQAPFPGLIAHHPGTDILSGHGNAFHTATIENGEDASSYFEKSGIADLADENGGLCTFWLGDNLALYQNTNIPLVNDDELEPSINMNADLFGSFMGSLHSENLIHHQKRAIVERALGNVRFISGLDMHIQTAANDYLIQIKDKKLPLDNFTLYMVAHIDSGLPGILDFNEKPLTYYLSSKKYGYAARNFFDIASEVISKVNTDSIKDADLVVNMTRDMLEENFASLSTAPISNMVRAQFTQWKLPFSLESIHSLSTSELKEIGTIIIATYDTTSLSLLWALAYLGDNPIAQDLLKVSIDTEDNPVELASLLVLEALRLGGSNPTALWRRVRRPFVIHHQGADITIPANTMLWLDRRRANRNANVFPYPDQFDIRNIKHIMKEENEKTTSILSRSRHEINSFNMVNTNLSPRKCPGRLFSVREQALILVELFRGYSVSIVGTDLTLASHSSMPRPTSPGIIQISPRE